MMSSNIQRERRANSHTDYLPVSSIQELIDNEAALQVVSEFNARTGHRCPRCKSVYVQTVNTKIFRELIRCVDCSYMFNGLSGTVFQGAKIPVMRYFQAMVIIDISMGKVSAKDISFSLDVTLKTAVALGRKLGTIPNRWSYFDFETRAGLSGANMSVASISGDAIRAGILADHGECSRFLAFCKMNNLGINRDLFLKRIEDMMVQQG